MIIKQTVTGTDDSLTVTCWIPGQSNARSHIVVIARDAFPNAKGLFRGRVHGGCWREERTDFYVVAHTVIDGQVAVHAPAILKKEAHGDIVKRIVGIADALDVRSRNSQTIRLQSRGARQGNSGSAVRKTECRCRESAKVHVAAEVQLKNLRLGRAQLDQIQIAAHLEGVLAVDQTDVVREFKPALDAVHRGVRFAPEIPKSGDIHRDIGAPRELWKTKVNPPAGDLRAEVMKCRVADDAGVLKRRVDIAGVVVA